MFPKYQSDMYKRKPNMFHKELSLRNFDNTLHLSDLSSTDIALYRDALSFYKHNTRNLYLQYTMGRGWRDVTFTYISIYNERKKIINLSPPDSNHQK
jgi:hemolysin activation/secretion protein